LEDCALLGHVGATAVLILTAVCFGLVPLFAKGLMETGTNSSAIAFYRYGFTALIMFPFYDIEQRETYFIENQPFDK
jgi:drug/metabolite transporter (DMT)-like permease